MRAKSTQILLLVVFIGALVGTGLAAIGVHAGYGDRGVAKVSEVIFPPQVIPLRFNHKRHLRMDLDCTDCHEDAAESRSSLDNLIPTEEPCAMCHHIDRANPDKGKARADDAPVRCTTCHPSYQRGQTIVQRVRIPAPNIKFSHKGHVRRGMNCRDCHGTVESVKVATRAQLPTMGRCLTCHDDRLASARCTTCHLAGAGGRMRTKLADGVLQPSGSLRGAAHDMNFRDHHARAARSDPAYCDSCHRKSFCLDCHNGVTKPMRLHVGDYVTLHAVDARRNQPDCSGCHRVQTFCIGCHSRSGVAADGRSSEFQPPSSGLLGPRFHPPGWVEFDGRGGLVSGPASRSAQHHSFQAQRNIQQCASCHREEFCKGCHSAERGAFRISPHPRRWRNSRRCRALAARSGRMCLRCHTDASEARCDFMGTGTNASGASGTRVIRSRPTQSAPLRSRSRSW